MNLPIFKHLEDIKKTLLESNTLIIQSPTGSGKTTGLPLELLNEPWLKGKILILEPRRIAARNAAYWMAKLLDEKVGERVGYSVHLDRKISKQTVIEVVTEGVFLRRIMNDPELTGVDLVIFDEFHERSLDIDLSLALLQDSISVLRDDLKLILMSATLELQPLLNYLNNPQVIVSEGRSFPVEIIYKEIDNNLIYGLKSLILEELISTNGSILVFLPGVGEIKRLEENLKESITGNIIISALYGNLSREQQEKAIEPAKKGFRKIVLSTPIAESSVTIKGIKTVIDSGLERKPVFNSRTLMNSLETRLISKSSADQRAGRAGREQAGKAIRTWSKNIALDDGVTPGILNQDLCQLVLNINKWGYKKIEDLNWLTPPGIKSFNNASEFLSSLGLINNVGITVLGEEIIKYPLHPRLGFLVNLSSNNKKKGLGAFLSAILSEKDIVKYPKDLYQCDILYRFDAIRKKSIFGGSLNKSTLNRVIEKKNSITRDKLCEETSLISEFLIKAYPDRIGKALGDGQFTLSNGSNCFIPEYDSLYHSKYIVAPSIGGVGNSNRVFLAISIDLNEIQSSIVEKLKWRNKTSFNQQNNKFTSKKQLCLGHLVLKEENNRGLSQNEFIQSLMLFLEEGGIEFYTMSKWLKNFLNRVKYINEKLNGKFPQINGVFKCFSWLEPYLYNFTIKSRLEDLPIEHAIKGLFNYQDIQKIDSLAPTHYIVPSGSKIPIDYSNNEPVLKVRIQELFGLLETPIICGDSLVIHLLSPASRPIQITKDLNSFWANTYMEVKKDLKGRYPKHYWPEDPFTAIATNRVKKRS